MRESKLNRSELWLMREICMYMERGYNEYDDIYVYQCARWSMLIQISAGKGEKTSRAGDGSEGTGFSLESTGVNRGYAGIECLCDCAGGDDGSF